MKRNSMFLTMALMASYISIGQNVTGLWEGKMNAGVELKMIFQFIQDADKNIYASIDCPDAGIKGLKSSSVSLAGDSIKIEIQQIGGSFLGKIVNDSLINGNWQQGSTLVLNLKKVKKIQMDSGIKRPQTPLPPFPYTNEDVEYYNPDKSIKYGATITIPEGKGPFPAALLLTGSGQQNRDEQILGHKPFAVIADYLTRKGFIVLRVDDRGVGQTTGNVTNATTRDFANDAIVSLGYLKNRKEVNKNEIGLIGHSEGGMIAQIVAAEQADIDFIIFLAAPGEKVLKLMEEQNQAILTSAGMSPDYVAQYIQLYHELLPAIINAKTDSLAKQIAKVIVNSWITKASQDIVRTTTGIHDDKTKTQFVNAMVSAAYNPWFRYFFNYDPGPYIMQIKAKVLVLNGDKDIQVISKGNLAGFETALKNGNSKVYEIKELKGVNHLFQRCKACTLQEYGMLDETISEEVLEVMAEWLKKHVS